jgi:hypothetical protein
MSSRSRRGPLPVCGGGLEAESVVRAGCFGGSAREGGCRPLHFLTPYGWWLRAQVSRDAPPPLPGGYKVGEKVFCAVASKTFPSGIKVVHGQQGEVAGPGFGYDKDQRVAVRFSGIKANANCYLTSVRRLHAASAASPRLHPTHATLPMPRAFPRQPLPRRPSPHCMRSRSRRTAHCPGAGGLVAEGVVRGVTASVAAPERAAAEPYTSLLLTAGGCVRR